MSPEFNLIENMCTHVRLFERHGGKGRVGEKAREEKRDGERERERESAAGRGEGIMYSCVIHTFWQLECIRMTDTI